MFASTGPENRICGRHRIKRSKYEEWAEGPGEGFLNSGDDDI